jgi:GNAT superfamily N-acetyltransferase
MLTVRPATLDDVPALAALLGQLFAQEAEFSPDPVLQARGLTALIGDKGSGRILVAEKDSRPVGMVNLIYVISTALGARVAMLEDVVVDKTCRGNGIGTKLLASAIETARSDGCQRITLLTDADNINAHKFYESFGFARSAMVPLRLMLKKTRMA